MEINQQEVALEGEQGGDTRTTEERDDVSGREEAAVELECAVHCMEAPTGGDANKN